MTTTDIEIPNDIMEQILYFCSCIQNRKYMNYVSNQPIVEDFDTGLDAFSAFYYAVASNGDPAPTREPTLLKNLFNVSKGIRCMIETTAFDLCYDMMTLREFETWCRIQNIPAWAKTEIYRERARLKEDQ